MRIYFRASNGTVVQRGQHTEGCRAIALSALAAKVRTTDKPVKLGVGEISPYNRSRPSNALQCLALVMSPWPELEVERIKAGMTGMSPSFAYHPFCVHFMWKAKNRRLGAMPRWQDFDNSAGFREEVIRVVGLQGEFASKAPRPMNIGRQTIGRIYKCWRVEKTHFGNSFAFFPHALSVFDLFKYIALGNTIGYKDVRNWRRRGNQGLGDPFPYGHGQDVGTSGDHPFIQYQINAKFREFVNNERKTTA